MDTLNGREHVYARGSVAEVDGDAAGKAGGQEKDAPFPALSAPRLDSGKSLKPGMHLKTPDGQIAVVVGGSVPAAHDGWMWDLTVPGNNDHDFYVLPGESGSGSTYHHVDEHGVTAVLVHNVNEPCDIPTLTTYAMQIRLSGNDDIAIRSRVIAVGQDDAQAT